MTYSEKLKDPRWQKKRLQILQRDNWECKSDFCFHQWDEPKPYLTIHHKRYRKGADPWDYPDENLITLCQPCHEWASLDRRSQAIELLKKGLIDLDADEILALAIDLGNLGLFRRNGTDPTSISKIKELIREFGGKIRIGLSKGGVG